MSRKIALAVIGLLTVGSLALASSPPAAAPPQATVTTQAPRLVLKPVPQTAAPQPKQIFAHGDCSWLPALATEAGWPPETHKRLERIVRRESGCCPNVRGGDIVDSNCVFQKVAVWNHRSDSGLLQINGVHWKRDHPQYHGLVCKQMGICEQEPLLDPLTNLKAGKLLYDVAGWSPWRRPSD